MNGSLINPVPASASAVPSPALETPLTWLDLLAVVLVVGNLSLGRSFAHLGVPPLYIGEASLAFYLLLRWRLLLTTWMGALVRPEPLTALIWLLTLSGIYGLIQCYRGIDAGHDRMSALQNVTFHIYPLFLFFGLETGMRHRDFTLRLVRLLAWVHGLYGFFFMAVWLPQMGLPEDLNPEEASLFGDPVGSAIVLLGLLTLERRWSRIWMPLLLNLSVLLALQVRAEILGLVIGLLLWSFLTGRFLQLCGLALIGIALLLAAAAVDLRISSPGTRGGELSAQALVGKLIAPFDSRAAQAYKRDADVDSETVEWRTGWWRVLWRMVHKTPERTWFGLGYGFAIWDVHPLAPLETKVRSPHNVFMYALAYTGWVGVALFATIQAALAWLLYRAYRVGGQPFGLCLWALLLVKGSFENFFEAPFNAIPFYLLIGLVLAPLFSGETQSMAERACVSDPRDFRSRGAYATPRTFNGGLL